MFEQKLKELNPTLPSITYDISDLYCYLDSLVSFPPPPELSLHGPQSPPGPEMPLLLCMPPGNPNQQDISALV